MNKKIVPKLILREDLISKNGKARIEFLLYFNRKQFRISSGQSIEPKYWLTQLECVDKSSEDANEINQILSDRLAQFDKHIQTKKILNQEIIVSEMKAILKGQSAVTEKCEPSAKIHPPTIGEAFDLFLKESDPKRQGTKVNYLMTKKILVDYSILKNKKDIHINQINLSFLNGFKNYLRNQRLQPNNKNTIAKRLKILHTILRFAVQNDQLDKDPMLGYKIEYEAPREVALTEEEYRKLRTLKLHLSACYSMKLTKDIFIFCCETGVRYSDAQDLKWEHILPAFKAISKKQVKTSKDVYVPLSNQAKAILICYKNKYKNHEGYVFPRIDNQIMNRYLKEIATLSDIKKNLTTHVARHTFGTRLGASGIASAFTISELMGHSDIAMTQRYINLSKTDLEQTMERVWKQKNELIKASEKIL